MCALPRHKRARGGIYDVFTAPFCGGLLSQTLARVAVGGLVPALVDFPDNLLKGFMQSLKLGTRLQHVSVLGLPEPLGTLVRTICAVRGKSQTPAAPVCGQRKLRHSSVGHEACGGHQKVRISVDHAWKRTLKSTASRAPHEPDRSVLVGLLALSALLGREFQRKGFIVVTLQLGSARSTVGQDKADKNIVCLAG